MSPDKTTLSLGRTVAVSAILALLAAPVLAQSRSQQFNDAKAMVAENWADASKQIEVFSVGHACRFLDDMTAGVAIRGIQTQMRTTQRNAGLPDNSLNLSEYTDTAVQAGEKDAKSGACDRLKPSDRARLQQYARSFGGTPHF